MDNHWTEKTVDGFNRFIEMIGEMSEGGFTKLAPLAMPAAPAFFFGWAIGAAVYGLTDLELAGICVGVAAAVGYEGSGFLSFHVASLVYRRGGSFASAAIYPIIYLTVGIATLWLVEGGIIDSVGNGQRVAIIGTAMLLIMANIYAALATHGRITDEIEATIAEKKDAENIKKQAEQLEYQREQERVAWEREQDALDRQVQRDLKRQRAADKTAVELAKLESKSAKNERSLSGHLAVTWPSDYRLLDSDQKQLIEQITTDELEELAGISESTARRWKRKVTANGHINGHIK